jgi:hypothetical protein
MAASGAKRTLGSSPAALAYPAVPQTRRERRSPELSKSLDARTCVPKGKARRFGENSISRERLGCFGAKPAHRFRPNAWRMLASSCLKIAPENGSRIGAGRGQGTEIQHSPVCRRTVGVGPKGRRRNVLIRHAHPSIDVPEVWRYDAGGRAANGRETWTEPCSSPS